MEPVVCRLTAAAAGQTDADSPSLPAVHNTTGSHYIQDPLKTLSK